MLRVGLTGGLACGKSTVAKMMAELGAQVLDADQLTRELMQPGNTVHAEIVKAFGSSSLGPDETIDRTKLAEVVFSTGRIKDLNAIVHPAVIERQNDWMDAVGKRDSHAIAVVEAALIVEAGVRGRFDRLVVVTCDEDQKVSRFRERMRAGGSPLTDSRLREDARRRMTAQLTDTEKAAAADFVINNSGSLQELKAQVEELMRRLQSVA